MSGTKEAAPDSIGADRAPERDGQAALGAGERLQQQLGLGVDPFNESALPDFYFVGGQRRYLVQQCVHQLYFGAPMVLLIGAWGSGKSRLLAEVRKELAGLADLCLTAATVMTDAAALRQEVAQAAGLPAGAAHSNETLLASLDRVRPQHVQPQPVLLLLDDAHLLAPVELAACCELIQGARGRIRALLAAEVSLFASWPPQLRAADGVVARLDLDPLDPRESVDYLRTRLQAAGLRQPLPLDAAAEKQLFKDSRGNLAAIHEAGLRLLSVAIDPGPSAAPAGGSRRWRAAGPPRHVGGKHKAIAVGLVLAVLGLAITMLVGEESEPVPAVASAALATAPAGDEAGRKRVPLVLEWGDQSAAGESLPADADAPRPAAAPDSRAAEPGAAAGGDLQPAPVSDAGRINRGRNVPDTAPLPERAEPAHVEPGPPAPATPGEPPAPSPVAESGTADRFSGPTGSDEQALLALDAGQAVMVQLMGARSLTDLRASVERSGHRGRVYYVQTGMGGKPWFVALIGPYGRDEAGRAIAGLPAALRAAKPWPRPLAAIQADIRRQRKLS